MKVNQMQNEYPGREFGFIDLSALANSLLWVIDESSIGQKLDEALNLKGRLSEGMGSAESYERAFALKDFLAQYSSHISSKVKDSVSYAAGVFLNHPDVQTFFFHTKIDSKSPKTDEFPSTFLLASKEINAVGIAEGLLELFRNQISAVEMEHVARIRSALNESPAAIRRSIKDLKSRSKLLEKDFGKVLEILEHFANRWQQLSKKNDI